jgi:hypothetical protein
LEDGAGGEREPWYQALMALLRFVSPVAALADLRLFFAARKRHEFIFAALAMAVPGFFIAMFILSTKEAPYKNPDIIFIQDYTGGRTDAQIRAQQKIDSAKAKAQKAIEDADEAKRQQFFKDIGNGMDAVGL